MPRPTANPYHLGDPVRATLNTRDTAILDWIDVVHQTVITVPFSQATAAVGGSPRWRNPSVQKLVKFLSLSVETAPADDYVVDFRRNGTTIETLTVPGGTTDDIWLVVDFPVPAGQYISVYTTSAGGATPPQGCCAQFDMLVDVTA